MCTHATVQCGAVNAEQLGGLADLACGKFQCGGDVLTFLFAQIMIQIEAALLQLLFYRSRGGAPFRVCGRFQRVELVLQLHLVDCLSGIFCGQPDDDVA